MDQPKVDFGEHDACFDRLMRGAGWAPVLNLAQFLVELLVNGESRVDPAASVHTSAIVTRSVIGPGVEIYEGVTVRDSVVMSGCTVGHACEVARSVVLPRSFLPRFDYVGGSIVGAGTQLGCNVSLATKRYDDRETQVLDEHLTPVSRWKLGALVGRDCVLAFGVHANPGAIIGHDTIVHPHVDLRGCIPPESLVMSQSVPKILQRRDFGGTPYPRLEDWT